MLDKVSRRTDLTRTERETIARTTALRSASVEVDRGKSRLLAGEFDSAAASFRIANDYYHSKKLALVLLCMRIAPRLLRRVYQYRVA